MKGSCWREGERHFQTLTANNIFYRQHRLLLKKLPSSKFQILFCRTSRQSIKTFSFKPHKVVQLETIHALMIYIGFHVMFFRFLFKYNIVAGGERKRRKQKQHWSAMLRQVRLPTPSKQELLERRSNGAVGSCTFFLNFHLSKLWRSFEQCLAFF